MQLHKQIGSKSEVKKTLIFRSRPSGTRICSGTFHNPMDCDLDQGAALVCSVQDRATISGLLSAKPSCGDSSQKQHNAYVRVAKYADWIRTRLAL